MKKETVISGPLPNGDEYIIRIVGDPSPKALKYIERIIALTRSVVEEDNKENLDGDGI